MTATISPMEISDDDDELSDTDTCIYRDQDIDSSDDEITQNNWRYNFQETLNNIHENKLDNGARPLLLDGLCKIRIKKLSDTAYTFPLSSTLCSRIICEHGTPLSLSNKYEFCGTKPTNTAWQIDREVIDFPLSFSAAIQASAFEQLHLNQPDINLHFDLNLDKLVIFGPCTHTKIYNFDDKLFIYHATVLVFLPSCYTGGNYRFVDDSDDQENVHRHIFNQSESDKEKSFILVLPSDCQHEIEPIEKGYKFLLVYHLVSKTNSIHQLYSLLSNSNAELMNIEHIFQSQRLRQIFSYWEKNLNQMPKKLLIPLQNPVDYSPYFSILFRDKYRLALQIIMTALKYSSSLLAYSAMFQYEKSVDDPSESRFLIHHVKLLNTTNKITLDLHPQHERTIIPSEFLGELNSYIDTFEPIGRTKPIPNTNTNMFRIDMKYHVLIIIPHEYQWDLLLDDHLFAYHHLSYMLSLPTKSLTNLCFNLFNCILHDKLSPTYSYDKLMNYLILLRKRFGMTRKLIPCVKILFQNKLFREELFLNSNLHPWLNRLVESFSNYSMFSNEILDLFRKIMSLSMPTKLNELIQFLLQFSNKTLRALFINTLLRCIFKRRGFSRHILLSTLCSIFHLLTIDGSYSDDCLLAVAYHIIKRVRNTSTDNEIIEKCLKMHLIPMLINIYRDKQKRKYKSANPLPSAFVLIYEYCLNTLNCYCSTNFSSSSFSIISKNEALLICPCESCTELHEFLIDSKISTLIIDLSLRSVPDHCLRHTLSKFPMLAVEYKHDPSTGREQTLIISKCAYEQEQKQLCFHLRRLLNELHRI